MAVAAGPTEMDTVVKRILPYLRQRGYEVEVDLDFETPLKSTSRSQLGYADIIVTNGKKTPQFVIEAKKSGKTLTATDREQALSYGRSLKVLLVAVTNGRDIRAYNVRNGQQVLWNGRLDDRMPRREQLGRVLSQLKANPDCIDVRLDGDTGLPYRPGLPLKQMNALFKRCHNTIRQIEKDEEKVFADFSKFLFLKLLEEKNDVEGFPLPYSYRFHELAERPVTESDQVKTAIVSMIEDIVRKTKYGDVLAEPISFRKPATFWKIVVELARISFHDSNFDSKGAAFEYYVRATLKGKRLGQYFTPRPLIDMMLAMVGRRKVLNAALAHEDVKVLDPACGTGGFLVHAMQDSLRQLEEQHAARGMTKQTCDAVRKRLKEEVFYGSDANHGVASAAKMNMIIAGDGHSNISAEDSLPERASHWHIASPDCDIILTNPPFGTSESESLDSEDLQQYRLPGAKGQYLFLQKMVLCTKPGGDICSVIDEGVLNTDSGRELRQWLLQKCRLRSIVRLPDDTFKPNKINVKASLLHLVRYENDDTDLQNDYAVAFCDLLSLGYYGSGEPVRGFDWPRFIAEFESGLYQVVDGVRTGHQWRAFDVRSKSIAADPTFRLDLKYWEVGIRRQIGDLRASGGVPTKGINLIDTARGKSPTVSLYVDPPPDGYAFVVKAGNISKFGELVTDGDWVEKVVYDEMAQAQVQRGDILLASTGDGTLGKCCIYDCDTPAIADGHVTIIRPDTNRVTAEYLCDYLRAGFGRQQIERLFTGSTGMVELTPDHVDSVLVDTLAGDTAAQAALSFALRSAESSFANTVEGAAETLALARAAFLCPTPSAP